jgi:hypothetical protein
MSIFQARRHRVHAARSSGARDTWLVRNWLEWHRDYERPGSSLSQRLQVVQGRLQEALEEVDPQSGGPQPLRR